MIQGEDKNWTIIRPYITYGVYRLQLCTYEIDNWLYRAINKRTIICDEDILNKQTTMTHGLDVAKRIYKLVGNSDAIGEIFQITSNQSIIWEEVMNIYFDAIQEKLGFRPKCQKVKNLVKTLGIQNSKYQVCYDRMYNRRFDSEKVNIICCDNSYIDIRKGLRNSIEKFLEKPKFGDINWKFEASKDRITGDVVNKDEIGDSEGYEKYIKYRY